MLGFFPRPGDDELLYSVVARYGAMTGQGVGGQLIQDFFGTAVGVTAIDLPCHIDRLVERIPAGHSFDRDRIIDQHTLFPYQLRFAPAEIAASVRSYMAGNGSRRPARLGVMSAAFPARERMMLCSMCAREDASLLGVGMWRRVHQLPGVLVCPRHGGPLSETSVKRLDRHGKGALLPMSREIRSGARPLKLSCGAMEQFLGFARRSEKMLRGDAKPCDVDELQLRLRSLLAHYRWSRAPTLIHTAAMVVDFGKHPGIRSLMVAINLTWSDGQMETAFNRMLHKNTVAKHPLMVLMLLELVGASLDDLATPMTEIAPPPERKEILGRSKASVRHDLPCGNPACDRFAGSLSIALRSIAPPDRAVRAKCLECEYAYLWDQRRPGAVCVAETGAIWDDLLKRTLSMPGTGIRSASRTVGVGPTTVMRHARRLGLWREEWTDRPKLRLRHESLGDRLLVRHKAQWLKYLAEGKLSPVKEMPKATFNAYRYLVRKEKGWFLENRSSK